MKRLVLIGLLFTGCPKDEPEQPRFDPDDRLLQKLKSERERLEAEKKKRAEPEPDPLAQVVTNGTKPDYLGVPEGVAAPLGPVELSLIDVQRSQTVSGAKLSLSTADRFLRVTLKAKTSEKITLDLSGARLENGDASVGVARDVQRLGKGSPLSLVLDTAGTERVVLFFEAPDEMIGKGLKIVLTTPDSRVELPLQ